LPEGLTVIAGGLDKGLVLDLFCELLVDHVKHVILIGEISERLHEQLTASGHRSLHRSTTMKDAVDRAVELTDVGGVISLSPACSSFDMYDSYAQRGEIFMDIVVSL
jgi:UDP-N-acetylmuramoylalanine--D-glutamate ligase